MPPEGPNARLQPTRLLDPRNTRDARAAPITAAVNIPLHELPRRTHELPPRECEIQVVGPRELAERSVAWLRDCGRQALIAAADESATCASDASGAPLRLWTPTEFLENTLAKLPTGRALDCACGAGRDAVFLADAGWSVVGVDVLPDALERAADLATRYLANSHAVTWRQTDLEAGELDDAAFEARFDLITTFRYLHRPLFERIRRWLRPGGHLLVETFTTLHRARHGKPSRDAFVLEPGELSTLLRGFDLLHDSGDWRGAVHTARAWAQLPI